MFREHSFIYLFFLKQVLLLSFKSEIIQPQIRADRSYNGVDGYLTPSCIMHYLGKFLSRKVIKLLKIKERNKKIDNEQK